MERGQNLLISTDPHDSFQSARDVCHSARVTKRERRRAPTLRIENEYDPEVVPQYFQVTVNVLEAKNLAWAHPQTATSYVVVALGKKRRRSHWRKNMEEPYYREYFVFELYTSLRDVQRKSIRLAVMESRRCWPSRLLGEANVDLSAIWEQPCCCATDLSVRSGNRAQGGIKFVRRPHCTAPALQCGRVLRVVCIVYSQ
ncbi:Otoferlin [Eumeta japonica]|uniref:Otoferlin n=1 Tax=Eumeta variegata TaxID=151549 RepID=A0A4C1ZI32_EUMVA|nr:Otoferlin [Eumeta japonica]